MSVNEFGGPWSETKNEVVADYLSAYTTALRDKFRLTYIDACAGSGWRRTTRLTVGQAELPLGLSTTTEGSALRALQLPVPFHRYFFNEPNEAHRTTLQATCAAYIAKRYGGGWHPEVEYGGSNVNTALPSYCSSLDRRTDRAVAFLDPYGMQVDWPTIEAIAATRVIDLWCLVPTGIALNRLATNRGRISPAWNRAFARHLGDADWQRHIYRTESSNDLFAGQVQHRVKTADIEALERYVLGRFRAVFRDGVHKTGLRLNRKRDQPLFLLVFACSNPSRVARGLALKLVDHIIGKANGRTV